MTALLLHSKRILAGLCLGGMAIAAIAAEPDDHRHEPLIVDETLTLSAAVDAALDAYPDTPTIYARRRQAEAWQDRGRSFLSARPALSMRVQSDRFGSDAGLQEYETGIELPLWALGGRRAVRDYGAALGVESDAAQSALRWEVAGLVRSALWNVALAEADLALAGKAFDTAARLARVVERRHELGDVALGDVLLADAAALEFQTAVIEASAAMLDAERTWRPVTGLERRPRFIAETRSAEHEIVADHPALAFANAAIATAEADVEVAERTAQSGATVFVGTRRERPANGPQFDDSIGVIVSVPFGADSHRRTEISAAARRASQARAERNRQVRDLTLAMHEAAHGLDVVRQNLAAANERLELAGRQQAMAESAYEKGEMELLDLLRIQATAIAAQRQVVGLEIRHQRQTALYNQAMGDLP